MKPLLIAFQFLTIIPIKVQDPQEKDFGRSLFYFPLTGCLIGVLLGGFAAALYFLPPMTAAAILTAASVGLTGGIHLDGFADTWDGLYGGKNKDRSLEIMRDSRIGVMGAAGVFLLLLLKFSVFVSFPSHELWKILIVSAAFSRWAQSFACAFFKYARDEGKALHFIYHARRADIVLGLIFVSALSFYFWKFRGVLFIFISFLPVFFFMKWIERRIGGMTGDTIGAVNEVAENVALVLGWSLLLNAGH